MNAGSMVRYAIAWLGFVAMGYGLTLMFVDRDTPAAGTADATAPDADAAANGAVERDAPADEQTVNIAHINIALADLAGGEARLDKWRGQPLVVNFWATWCAPCRKEIPLLKTLQDEYADDELAIVGVAIDEMDAVKAYDGDIEFNYPVLVGEESGFRLASAIGVTNFYVPITAFVDRAGEVRRIHTGEIHREDAEFAIAEIVAR